MAGLKTILLYLSQTATNHFIQRFFARVAKLLNFKSAPLKCMKKQNTGLLPIGTIVSKKALRPILKKESWAKGQKKN